MIGMMRVIIKMKPLTFNKTLTSKRQGSDPSVTFRKLPDTGNEARYQGSINTKGIKLLKSLVDGYTGLQVVFSDLHPMVGLMPLTSESKGVKSAFGATELFKNLNLVVGKKYTLVVSKDSERQSSLLVINSNEHI